MSTTRLPPFVMQQLILELKPPLEHLKYAYLEVDNEKPPITVAKNFQVEQEEKIVN